jgi:hypothetical protein
MRALLALAAVVFSVGGAEAQELGRLFFTPEQRAALDARRKARVPDKPAAAAVISPTTRMDGFVKRSGGPATVWVNGESLPENAPEAPRIQAGRAGNPSVSISVGETGRRAALRPGEVLDRGNGEVRDVIGEGEIRIRRAPEKK